jgi:hypothetical protein
VECHLYVISPGLGGGDGTLFLHGALFYSGSTLRG